jgi:hypothetical protein
MNVSPPSARMADQREARAPRAWPERRDTFWGEQVAEQVQPAAGHHRGRELPEIPRHGVCSNRPDQCGCCVSRV